MAGFNDTYQAALRIAPSAETRLLIELEAENHRLRKAIAHLSGSLLTQRPNGCPNG